MLSRSTLFSGRVCRPLASVPVARRHDFVFHPQIVSEKWHAAESDAIQWMRRIAESRTVYRAGASRARDFKLRSSTAHTLHLPVFGPFTGHLPVLALNSEPDNRSMMNTDSDKKSVIEALSLLAQSTRVAREVSFDHETFRRLSPKDVKNMAKFDNSELKDGFFMITHDDSNHIIVPEREIWTNAADEKELIALAVSSLYTMHNDASHALKISTIQCYDMPADDIQLLHCLWQLNRNRPDYLCDSLQRILTAYDTMNAQRQTGILMNLRKARSAQATYINCGGKLHPALRLSYDTPTREISCRNLPIYHSVSQLILPDFGLVVKWHLRIECHADSSILQRHFASYLTELQPLIIF